MSLADASNDPELAKLRREQQGFRWRWVLASLGIFLVVQMGPLLLLGLDGWVGVGLSVSVWFIGGLVVGFVSPGKTIFEPALAALGTAVPTMLWLHAVTPAGIGPSALAYVAAGVAGVSLGLFGAVWARRSRSSRRADSPAPIC
jgi:hypothetical protein